MRLIARCLVAMTISLLVTVASSAHAQKAGDTLRLAINDPFPVLSPYHHSVDESINFYRQVYQRLLDFDDNARDFVPALATSWKRVNPTTLEFDLREGVTFHNGNTFDADDVVATFDYARDPKVPLRSKERYTWVKNVEKLGPYKVRVEGSVISALDIGFLTYLFPVFDGESLNSLDKKEDYGRATPFGTGPYRVTDLDTNRGVTVERADNYKGPSYARAPIKKIRGIPIPDRQTQVAQLLTGGIDMIRNVLPDSARELAKDPRFSVSDVPTADVVIFGLDATGKSGNQALTDVRVRRAIWMAIDRDRLIKHIVPGGDSGTAEKMNGLCFPEQNIACAIGSGPAGYDPASAKRLLAEAGFANGFELKFDVFAPIRQIGEAIAGDLLRVGIKATVQPQPISVYIQRQNRKEQEAYMIFYPTQLFPDAGYILQLYFEANDRSGDTLIHQAVRDGLMELDTKKRTEIYQRAYDRNNDMIYTMAISSLPNVYVHTADIRIDRNPLSKGATNIGDYFWK